MQETIITKFKNVSAKLLGQTKVCKICFRNIKDSSFNLVNRTNICENCLRQFKPIFEKFKIDGIKGLAIYEYDELLKKLIYQFKGCYDIELHDIFLGKYKREIETFFRGYTIIPAPSSDSDNLVRGFNHVEAMFSNLNLPIEKHFIKEGDYKQADHNFYERKNIKNYIKIENEIFTKKKYLLVDDIYTTGSTMRTMIKLLKERGISDIKVLVLCKTRLKENI